MTGIIDELPSLFFLGPGLEKHYRTELVAAKGSTRWFTQIVSRLGIKFATVKATWTWSVRTVADEVIAGTRADAVEWLAGWVYRECDRALQQSMQQAWHDAFDHHPAAWFMESALCDTDQCSGPDPLFEAWPRPAVLTPQTRPVGNTDR